VDINCAAIPETLLESELFGFEKGSFTGANTNGKIGLIELANNGTLLLDEISEMPLNLQAKLLKTIQDKEIKRIGGTKILKVDFRLIAATNRNLEHLVSQGIFREDLYYRLNVVNIDIPPLNDRTKDIIPLCNYFLNKFNKKFNVKKQLNEDTLVTLLKYEWPGNVRELANVIERAIVTSEGEYIKKDILPKKIAKSKSCNTDNYDSLKHAIEELEGEMIRSAYEKYATSEKVGGALKISQATAYRKIAKYVFNQN
jgi:transcriptional regulator with PAS, ATPase and Fis domain